MRESRVVPGVEHGSNPIPSVVRVGEWVYTSAIGGRDPANGQVIPEPHAQVEQTFRNLRAALEAAGATLDHVVKVDVWLADMSLRGRLNEEWKKYFPDLNHCPVRHTMSAQLPEGMQIQIQAVAIVRE
ncbi:MAG: RidA family protein [Firmicutes bacterium]|nr:RidA family protein [Bacillota bacterium]